MAEDLKKVVEYLSREGPVIAVYLFGSTAKGKETAKSDIDLGILLKEDFDFLADFTYKLRLMGVLKDITGKTVDIVFINRADSILQYQIRKYGKVIFESDRTGRIEYEVQARKNYFDFLPMHKKYMEKAMSRF